jgi:hypothetical protein
MLPERPLMIGVFLIIESLHLPSSSASIMVRCAIPRQFKDGIGLLRQSWSSRVRLSLPLSLHHYKPSHGQP